jgi:UDP-N-acetylmuramoylalanine--D-glutamate ligase
MPLDLSGKRMAVIGMARSGIGAAKLIIRLGGRALISDVKPASALASATEELRQVGIESEHGGHTRILSEPFDLIVLSPGVVPPKELEAHWTATRTPVWSELELAARACDSRWIGVTGSNGKTTTVHLIAAMLNEAGLKASMAGNVGTAWSGLLPIPSDHVFVVEVSSFQLENVLTIKPAVAVLLNLYENHLDRHGTMDVYAGLKARLFANQNSQDTAVLNGDDTWVQKVSMNFPARRVQFGRASSNDFWTEPGRLMCRVNGREEILIPRAELPLPGRHNELNALAAAAAASNFGADLDSIRRALRSATPVEHRIEFVRRLDGVSYFNDSKSTNMVATMTALDSFEKNVILLFGGRPKKESFAPLATRIPNPVKRLVVFGEAVAKTQGELPAGLPVDYVTDMEHALAAARTHAQAGDTILLSPGCTSFDQFNNFEERGQVFKSLVNR